MRKFINYLLDSEDRPLYGKLVRLMWLLVFGAVLSVVIFFIALSFSDLPSVEQLENPRSELASQVYAADQINVLGRYYTENRVPVSFEQLSPHLVNALIATEDERYYEHSGIDFKSLGRTAVKTVLLRQKSSGGASTITQQLAKQLFTENKASSFSKRAIQKFKEWIIAIRLERRYTKNEILAMYMNKFNWINNAYGIKAASEIYFSKSQDSLQLHEAAMLVGMLKAPWTYNPLRRPEATKNRRAVVLKQMQRNKLIDQATFDSLKTMPLGLRTSRQTHIDGLAPYFRMELAKYVKGILNKQENLKSDGTAYDIYKDGLKIYTTIDPQMQELAEEVMTTVHMPKVQDALWKTWRNMDPWKYRSDAKTEIPVSRRLEKLEQLVRASDRYQYLRDKHLSKVLKAIQSEVPDLVFHEDDREVERIVKESIKEGTIKRLVRNKLISKDLAAKYRQVLRSPHMSKLKEQWAKLEEAVESDFSQRVNMRVFAYNEGFEKDTLMSPMDSVKYHRMFLQAGILAVDPKTGHVKVWVGGINHKYFQFDHVRINRQVGSTFKPFVYATAIAQQGLSPCYLVDDVPVTISPGYGDFYLAEEWTPNNSHGTYSYQTYTLKQALAKSINTTSAFLMKQLASPEPVRDLVQQMGIDNSRVPSAPSIALGSTDLSVIEMTGAYTTFANNGIYNKPVFITKIEDKNGRIIYEEIPEERVALSPNQNYAMVDMLKFSGSTAMGNIKSQVGGKTGTTNDYVDGWYMGITPDLVVGTWVGGEDRWIRFRGIGYGQGSFMAKPFFREFIKRLEKMEHPNFDLNNKFYRPPGNLGIELDCDEYQKDVWDELDSEEEGEFIERGSGGFSNDIFADEIPAEFEEGTIRWDTTGQNRRN